MIRESRPQSINLCMCSESAILSMMCTLAVFLLWCMGAVAQSHRCCVILLTVYEQDRHRIYVRSRNTKHEDHREESSTFIHPSRIDARPSRPSRDAGAALETGSSSKEAFVDAEVTVAWAHDHRRYSVRGTFEGAYTQS